MTAAARGAGAAILAVLAGLLLAGLLLPAAPALAGTQGASAVALSRCTSPGPLGALGVTLPHLTRHLVKGGALRIVAIGSSSTAGAGATSPARNYPSRLAFYLARLWPGVSVSVVNAGVNGETADQMVRRFGHDVFERRPDLVIWQVGANTVLRRADVAVAAGRIRDGIHLLKKAGSDVVLMDLQYAPAMLARQRTDAMERLLAQIASQEAIGLFRRFAVMRQWVETRQAALSELVVADGIHQSDFGYDCVARTLAAALGSAARIPERAIPVAQGPVAPH